jgi:hypothetical protein
MVTNYRVNMVFELNSHYNVSVVGIKIQVQTPRLYRSSVRICKTELDICE